MTAQEVMNDFDEIIIAALGIRILAINPYRKLQLCPKRNAPFPVPERGTFLRNGTGTLYISSGLESKVKDRAFSKVFSRSSCLLKG